MRISEALQRATARAKDAPEQVFFVVYDPLDRDLFPLCRTGYAVLSEDAYNNSTIPEARCLWSTAEGWYDGAERYK